MRGTLVPETHDVHGTGNIGWHTVSSSRKEREIMSRLGCVCPLRLDSSCIQMWIYSIRLRIECCIIFRHSFSNSIKISLELSMVTCHSVLPLLGPCMSSSRHPTWAKSATGPVDQQLIHVSYQYKGPIVKAYRALQARSKSKTCFLSASAQPASQVNALLSNSCP